jgi:DNA-binding NarL/FixJ family response regulator
MTDKIRCILLVDDERMFHWIFEDACSILNISLTLKAIDSADRADQLFADWKNAPEGRPECVFVDLNLIGSTYNGIELVRRINKIHGNGVVIGIISSSTDPAEIEKAKQVGAQFWIVKSDDLEPRLEAFHQSYDSYVDRTAPFRVFA